MNQEGTQQQQQSQERVARVIDLRVPLPWLLGIGGSVGWALVSMYFSVNQLVRDVADLQITVKSGNTQVITLAGEIALLRFRVENLETQSRITSQMTQGSVSAQASATSRSTR